MIHDFIANRVVQLRQQKDVSAREMSLSIGMASNFIHTIENKKAMPSMEAFIYICDFLGISPQEFFDEENENPATINELVRLAKLLDGESLELIVRLASQLQKTKSR